ncbi:MAG TPA: DegQ family serine endoprotease [Burkholderiales bacterium]|nr:DegQ family serine endoprotease [Burkholderiales bacterium]
MRIKAVTAALIAAGVITAGAGAIKLYHPSVAHARTDSTVAAVQEAAPLPYALRAMPDFAALAERHGPAVVNISVTRATLAGADAQAMPRFGPDSPFYDFFRRFQIPVPQGEMPLHGVGSGVIVSPDGLVLTNAHVVAEASEVTVKLTDKREFKAKIVGADPQTDIAVLRIDAKDLPVARLGDAKSVRVGEWVVAIGSPYGFENTVTAGIVSATARALPDGTYVPFIQTDVAVNPGNSGGPLFNLKGEVIGINAQIYSGTGGYQGLSFAIPVDVAAKVMDQLVQHGKVTRGRIGVTIQELTQPLAESFGLKKPAGALVSAVDKDGPAARAGIETGDVILKVDGSEIRSSNELPPAIADIRPGSTVKLEVWRKGATREMTVRAGELQAAKSAQSPAAGKPQGRLGVAVRGLTPEERKQAGVEAGVLVENAGGAAARAGVRPGDIILSVNNAPVKDVEQLRDRITRAGKTAALLLQRDDARIFVPVELG